MRAENNSPDSACSTNNLDNMPTRNSEASQDYIDVKNHRFPHCIVWTPIPLITLEYNSSSITSLNIKYIFKIITNFNNITTN